MEHGKGLAVTVPGPCQSSTLPGGGAAWVCNVGHLLARRALRQPAASRLILANATINKNLFGVVCFAVYAEELLRIFISCPEQLNADCRPSGSSYKRGETCKWMAWHLELVSNCTQISMLPAVNQLICSAVIYILNPPGATSVAYLWAA